jgi:hypothetical protein
MKKRWIIRGIFIGLLTLCVVAWVGSYRGVVGVKYGAGTSHYYHLIVEFGWIRLLHTTTIYPAPAWQWYLVSANRRAVQEVYESVPHRFMGFGFMWVRSGGPGGWDVFIPMYFPTLVSALLLWFVWRKTRAMPVGGGFPVESAVATENSEPGDSLNVKT